MLKIYYPLFKTLSKAFDFSHRWDDSAFCSCSFDPMSFLFFCGVITLFFSKQKRREKKGTWFQKWNSNWSLVCGWARTGSTSRRRFSSRHNTKHIPPLRQLPLPLRDDWSKHRKWSVRHKVKAQCAVKVLIQCQNCTGWRSKCSKRRRRWMCLAAISFFWILKTVVEKSFQTPFKLTEEKAI